MLSIYSANPYHPLAGAASWTPPIFEVNVLYWLNQGGINQWCCCSILAKRKNLRLKWGRECLLIPNHRTVSRESAATGQLSGWRLCCRTLAASLTVHPYEAL